MNAADGRGPVDRLVGRLLEHAECHAHIAPQDDEQRQWAADLRSAAAELEHYVQASAAQAAELDRLRAENDRYSRERSDLALLVARLIRRLRAARDGEACRAGDDAMAAAALAYLQRKGLSSPLRNEAPNAEVTGRGPGANE